MVQDFLHPHRHIPIPSALNHEDEFYPGTRLRLVVIQAEEQGSWACHVCFLRAVPLSDTPEPIYDFVGSCFFETKGRAAGVFTLHGF